MKVMQAKFPKLAPFDRAFAAKTSVDDVVAVLVNGKGNDMKSFKDKLSPVEIRAVAAYVRSMAW